MELDEIGLNYRVAPCKLIGGAQMSGRKKDKVRLRNESDLGALRRNLDKDLDLTIGITREHGCVVTSSFRGFNGSMHTLVTLVTAK